MKFLGPEKAYIFRITHIRNVPWILRHGLHCRNAELCDPNFTEIGSQELIERRRHRVLPEPPGGNLGDYVPFYFTPLSPMLLNIKTGRGGVKQVPMSEIVIFKTSLFRLKAEDVSFIFSDRHAYLEAARFSSRIDDLDRIAWPLLRNRDFKRDPEKPEKLELYQAEALAYRHVPVRALDGIICHGPAEEARLKTEIEKENSDLKVAARPEWFF